MGKRAGKSHKIKLQDISVYLERKKKTFKVLKYAVICCCLKAKFGLLTLIIFQIIK